MSSLPDCIDPGIRPLVEQLNRWGFETTDSGDGSKASTMGCAVEWAHVFMKSSPESLVEDSHRLALLIENSGVVDLNEWAIEASYSPLDGMAHIFLHERGNGK